MEGIGGSSEMRVFDPNAIVLSTCMPGAAQVHCVHCGVGFYFQPATFEYNQKIVCPTCKRELQIVNP
jgi:hypothetical protein